VYESGKRTRTASGREDVAGMADRFNEMNRTQYLLQLMRLNLKSPDKSSGLCFICGLLNASRKFVPALFYRINHP
jgi:hypothetical protein